MKAIADADWRSRASVLAVLAALGGDANARVVGGAVRDALLGLPVADVDVATVHHPQETIRLLKAAGLKAVPTGIAHGTVTAVAAGEPIEVTTLRRDVSTDGRHAVVAYTDDWLEDAARRDFTINALYAEAGSARIHDYFNGLADLEARCVRFIGRPLARIAEDHLRIMRFFRFHARFGVGEPDAEGLSAATARANDLMALSRERIRDELIKLLDLPDPAPTMAIMVAHRILKPVLPEIEPAGVTRLERLIARERATSAESSSIRRLAALLGDDRALAVSVAYRLKLSKLATRALEGATGGGDASSASPAALAYRIGVEAARDRLLLGDASPDQVREALAVLSTWQRPRLPIGGGELIAMGVAAGPAVSTLLRQVEEDWIAADFTEDAGIIAEIARKRILSAL